MQESLLPGFDVAAELEINQTRLDYEWLMQPSKMHFVGVAYAQAIANRDRAKQSLDVTKSNLDAAIRNDAAQRGEKITESFIDQWIRRQPTYIQAQEALIDAERDLNLVQSAVYAFNARKTALENLVRLFSMNYFAEPVPPQGTGIAEMAVEQARATGRNGLKTMMPAAPPLGQTTSVEQPPSPVINPQPLLKRPV